MTHDTREKELCMCVFVCVRARGRAGGGAAEEKGQRSLSRLQEQNCVCFKGSLGAFRCL